MIPEIVKLSYDNIDTINKHLTALKNSPNYGALPLLDKKLNSKRFYNNFDVYAIIEDGEIVSMMIYALQWPTMESCLHIFVSNLSPRVEYVAYLFGFMFDKMNENGITKLVCALRVRNENSRYPGYFLPFLYKFLPKTKTMIKTTTLLETIEPNDIPKTFEGTLLFDRNVLSMKFFILEMTFDFMEVENELVA
jgi:hypothetical protein